MRAFAAPLATAAGPDGAGHLPGGGSMPGPVTYQRDPQALFAGESLAQALRQLVVYGRDGLPVLSADGQHVQGWVTNNRVLQTVACAVHTVQAQTAQGQLAAEWAMPDPGAALREPPTPLRGYQILEVTIADTSPAAGQPLRTLSWPPGCIPVSVVHNRRMRDPDPAVPEACGVVRGPACKGGSRECRALEFRVKAMEAAKSLEGRLVFIPPYRRWLTLPAPRDPHADTPQAGASNLRP